MFRTIAVVLLVFAVGVQANAAVPKVLKKADVQLYQEIFKAQAKNQFKTAGSAERKLANRLLMGYVLFDRYFSSKYKTNSKEIAKWMEKYSDLPIAVDMYALGQQKKVADLKKPKGLFGSNTRACESPARQEPVDLLNGLSFSYLDGDQKKQTAKKMREFARLIGKGELVKAQSILDDPQFTKKLSQEDADKAGTALAFSYILNGDNDQALEMIQKTLRYMSKKVPLSLWVAGLAYWRKGMLEEAADYFSDLAEFDSAPVALRTRAAYWAARAFLGMGKYSKVMRYLNQAAESPRYFYGMLAMRALGQDLNYVWEVPDSPGDEVTTNFSHPALERFYALRQLGKDEWASQELSKLYLESDDEAKTILMMISAQNGFDDVLQGFTGTLQGEESRYPMPNWKPQGGWTLDKELVYAFVRQESCFNNRAESYVGALGLMQLMPKTAKEVAGALQCPFSKRSLKDPAYNLRLGQTYLNQLLTLPQVQGNLMFVAVAYNAGPGNLNKWKNKMDYQDDPLMFLEVLPSKETRGFIERILINYWVYRNLTGSSLATLDNVVQGRWPIYENMPQMCEADSSTAESEP